MSSEEAVDFEASDAAVPQPPKFIFPPGFDIDGAWDSHLRILRDGCAISDFVQVSNALEFFEPVLSHRLFKANTSRVSRALPVLVDCILGEGIVLQPRLKHRMCHLFNKFVRQTPFVGFPSFSVNFGRIFAYFRRFLWNKPRNPIPRLGYLDDEFAFVQSCRVFFPASDSPEVIDRWADRIGCIDTKSSGALALLTMFLPVPALPLVADSLMRILCDFPSDAQVLCILTYLHTCTEFAPWTGLMFDWKPHLDTIVCAAAKCFRPTVPICGRPTNMIATARYDNALPKYLGRRTTSATQAGSLLGALLVAGPVGDAALERLEKLMRNMAPLITPRVHHGTGVCEFVCGLLRSVEKGLYRQHTAPGYAYMDAAQADNFVRIILPVVKALSFTWKHDAGEKGLELGIQILVGLAYNRVRCELFIDAVDRMYEPEMRKYTLRCNRIVKMLICSMFAAEHFHENLPLIPKILENVYLCIQTGTTAVFATAFKILNGLCSLLYIPADINGLPIATRMALTPMLTQFDDFLVSAIQIGSMVAQANDEMKRARSLFLNDVFFAAFDSSFIERKIQFIIDTMATSHHKSLSSGIFSAVVYAHHSLLGQLVDCVIDKYVAAPEQMREFWALSLAALFRPVPELRAVFPKAVTFIATVIGSDVKGRVKEVTSIATSLAHALIGVWGLDMACSPMSPNVTNMWGQVYSDGHLRPEFFQFTNEEIADCSTLLFETLRPLYDSFASLELNDQLILFWTVRAFGVIFSHSGDFDPSSSPTLHPKLAELFANVLEFGRKVLETSTSVPVITRAIYCLSSLVAIEFVAADSRARRVSVMRRTRDGRWMWHRARGVELARFAYAQAVVNGIHAVRWTPELEEFYRMAIMGKHFSDFKAVRKAALSFARSRVLEWDSELFPEICRRCFEYLRCENKSEWEFRGSLALLKHFLQSIIRNNELFSEFIIAFCHAKYDKTWPVDHAFRTLIGQCEHFYAFLRASPQYAQTFATLQEQIMKFDRGQLPELFWRALVHFVGCGPVPFTRSVFTLLWRFVVIIDESRKRVANGHILSFLGLIRPKAEAIILDHFPEEPYRFDNAVIGFIDEPRRVKVRVAPAVASANEIRQFLVEYFTPENSQNFFDGLIHLRSLQRKIQGDFCRLWMDLFLQLGTPLIELFEPLLNVENDTREFLVVSAELVTGLLHATKYWSEKDGQVAIDRIFIPHFTRLLQKTQSDYSSLIYSSLQTLFGDTDFRRRLWIVDIARSLIRDRQTLKNGIQVLIALADQSHPAAFSLVNELITSEVLPMVHPLSELTTTLVSDLAELLSSPLAKGISTLDKYDFGCVPLMFERVFDEEFEMSKDHLAIFLRHLHLERKSGLARTLPFIAERIVQIFSLRNDVTRVGEQSVEKLPQPLAVLPWNEDLEALGKVLDSLRKMFPGLQWFIKEMILRFVYQLCFTHMFDLPKEVLVGVSQKMLPLFIQDERVELRESGVKLTRMLILVLYDSLGQFYELAVEGQENGVISAANGSALLGAVSLLNGLPEWLPRLFIFLEVAHRRQHMYAKAIEVEFADFWKRAGPMEVPEIEDFRYCFSQNYFA
jgi:hypothetical protein